MNGFTSLRCWWGDALACPGGVLAAAAVLATLWYAKPVIAAEVVLHVSPAGNNAWTGSSAKPNTARTDGPLQSLAAAQKAVRTRLAAMALAGIHTAVRVQLAPGTYSLTAPLVFEPKDSGSVGFPVIWEASGGPVVVSGGVGLQGQAAETSGQVRWAALNVGREQMRGAGQFFVNNRRAVLARQPNAGAYWFVTHSVATSGEARGREGQSVFGVTPDTKAWLMQLSETDRKRAVVNVMQGWSLGRHRFEGTVIDAQVRIEPPALWPFLYFGTSQRFFIENVAAALDTPGEWLWDASGVHYRVLADEQGKTLLPVMPVLDRLIVIRGDASRGRWVQYLQFRGITFAETRSLTPSDGVVDFQAAVGLSAAIEVDGAHHIELKNCAVTRTGGYAIWFRRAVRDSLISDCELSDLGAGGVKIGEVKQAPNSPGSTGGNVVSNNRIHDIGKVYPGAVAVWIGQSFDNTVSYNTVFNTPYTGISVGWQWGYGEPTSGGNQIVGNLLYNIGQGQLSDLGAIYTLGPSPGTVINGNVIREVRAYPGYGAGAWGIYNDEGTSDVVIANNVVVGTDSGSYHLHYGRNNILRGNFFAHGDLGEVLLTRLDSDKSLEVKDNVLLPNMGQPFGGFAIAPDVLFTGNRVATGDAGDTLDISKCGKGCELVNLKLVTTSDPGEVKLSGADAETDARIMGIVTKAGSAKVAGAPAVTGQVQAAALHPVDILGPPLSLELDLNAVGLGERPVGMHYLPRKDANAIAVVTSANAVGGRCLRFQDRPDFPNNFEPYAFARLNHESGTSVGEFSLQIDPRSDLRYEWRDDAKPYRVGPSLRVSAQGVRVAGRIVSPVEVGEWLHFRIVAPVGEAAGKWRVEIQDGFGKTRIVADVANESPAWRAVRWAGFISDSVEKSSTCIAAVRFSSELNDLSR